MSDLPNKDAMIAYLSAKGLKISEIAEATGLSNDSIKTKLNTERMQFEVKHVRYKLYGKDHKQRFSQILPHAIDIAEKVLLDPNTKTATKFAAAQEFMDRALGKPKQTVEHEGSLIRSLFEKLDGRANEPAIMEGSFTELPESNPNEVRQLTPAANPNLQSDNPIDKWADENL